MKLFNIFKKKNGPKNKTKTKSDSSKGIFREFAYRFFAFIQIIVFLVLVLDIYFIASIFSLWTGKWGENARVFILGNLGGASLLLLIFTGYLCIAFLMRKKIFRPLSQVLGTAFLFIATSLVLGLLETAGILLHWQILRPGDFGTAMATYLVTNTGVFGAILFNFVCAVIAAYLYGFVKIGFIVERTGALRERTTLFLSRLREGSNRLSKSFKIDFPEKKATVDSKNSRNPQVTPKPGIPVNPVSTQGNPKNSVPFDFAESGYTENDGYILDSDGAYPETDYAGIQDAVEIKVEAGKFPPPLELFGSDDYNSIEFDKELIGEQGEQIIITLAQFGIEAELAETVIGPTVIQFQIQLAPGIKVSRVAGLSNDLAVALAITSLRVEAPIPFKPYVGIEIPNPQRAAVPIRTLLQSQEFKETGYTLPLISGLRVNSNPLIINLEELPHLLVAGTTGSGKSMFITSCITGLCCTRKPEELRLLLIDPKRVELSIYEKLPHVIAKPVVDPRKAVHALGWAVREMEHRYEIFSRSRVKNITSYNSKALPKDRLSRIVIIVDELADLMFTAQKDVEDFICRIAQMARATGIHLIIATQRPSVNVITGLIKANIPARVAFTLPSQADSRTIIDLSGAEKLLGRGDMLFVSSKYPRPLRVQSPYIEESHSINFINYMKDLFGEPEYVDLEDQGDRDNSVQAANLDDPLLEEAVNIVLNTGIASASRLQRQLRIGFTRAARIIDTLEQMGIVGPPDGSKPRDILVDEDTATEIFEENLR